MDSHHVQIDWNKDDNVVLMNPRWTPEVCEQSERLLAAAPALRAHVWLQSSGSSRDPRDSAKWLALPKSAFLASAAGVNQHLAATANDVWGVALPRFHVGGLSIEARAHLSGARVLSFAEVWNPEAFRQWLGKNQITLSSLVPTQLYDLVQRQMQAPRSLRAVVLGGARLERPLWIKARELGWPVMGSFGMTETCSQIATSRVDDFAMHLLSHVEARTDGEGFLWVKTPALYTGSLQTRSGVTHWETPRLEEGYWRSSDRAELIGRDLNPLGREGDFIKIKGEGVNISEVRSRFAAFVAERTRELDPRRWALVDLPDARDGSVLVLAVEGPRSDFEAIAQAWNFSCFPIERFVVRAVEQIPRSELGKIRWADLRNLIL